MNLKLQYRSKHEYNWLRLFSIRNFVCVSVCVRVSTFIWVLLLFYLNFVCCRLREERGDPDRPLPLDQKARDLSPRQCKFPSLFD